MNIILLGAPGSGKGTLAKSITKDFNIPQISTGDLFRAIVKENNPLARQIKEIMASGALVPDELTVELVKKRIAQEDCKNGFILDGFPRTVAQGEALEKLTHIDSVILVDLPFDKIIERLSSRRTCSSCGEIYNIQTHSSNICDKCQGELIQRDDDKPQTIKRRLEVYENSTAPLIDFYSERLFKVSSDASPEDTYRPVKAFLEKLEEKGE